MPSLLLLIYGVPSLAVSTYFMMELNNRNVLLRIRSRMVSCSFLMLATMCSSAYADPTVAFVQTCIAISVFILSATCQDRQSQGLIFYAFLLFGIASLVWVKVLWVIPIMLGICIAPLYSISIRSVSSLVMGFTLPYYLYAGYLVIGGDLSWLSAHFKPATDTSDFFRYDTVTISQLLSYVIMVIIASFSTIHFLLHTYEDKIRVRMLFYTYTIMAWLFLILIAIVPRQANYIIPIATIPTAALCAHWFAHTSSRFTNICFIVLLTLTFIITIFNQCLTSLSNLVLGAF